MRGMLWSRRIRLYGFSVEKAFSSALEPSSASSNSIPIKSRIWASISRSSFESSTTSATPTTYPFTRCFMCFEAAQMPLKSLKRISCTFPQEAYLRVTNHARNRYYMPSQFAAGVYPARSASSFVSNQILFSSLMRFAPEHHGKWYFVPFLEPTYAPDS